MAIHVHIHRGKARDAFGSGGIKRDKDGKFATSGTNGGDHEHHFEQGEHHARQAEKTKSTNPAASKAHADASEAHHNASEQLKARRLAQAQAFANEANKHTAKALALRGGKGMLMPKSAR